MAISNHDNVLQFRRIGHEIGDQALTGKFPVRNMADNFQQLLATLCNPAGWNEAEVALLQLQMVFDPERVLQAFGACIPTSSSQGRRFFVSKCFGQFYCGNFSKCF